MDNYIFELNEDVNRKGISYKNFSLKEKQLV